MRRGNPGLSVHLGRSGLLLLAGCHGCPHDTLPHGNTAPVAVCADQVVLAPEGTCTACVEVDGGSYDPDGDRITVSQDLTCDLFAGEHTVVLTVTDTQGLSDSCLAHVTVIGNNPLVVTTEEIALWPPDHTLVSSSLSDCATVSGGCGDPVDIDRDGVVTSAWSDEPEDATGGGDGHTLGDIVIDGSAFSARAERQGAGNGRVYAFSLVVTDSTGEQATGTCWVSVPHDDSGDPAVSDGPDAGYSVP